MKEIVCNLANPENSLAWGRISDLLASVGSKKSPRRATPLDHASHGMLPTASPLELEWGSRNVGFKRRAESRRTSSFKQFGSSNLDQVGYEMLITSWFQCLWCKVCSHLRYKDNYIPESILNDSGSLSNSCSIQFEARIMLCWAEQSLSWRGSVKETGIRNLLPAILTKCNIRRKCWEGPLGTWVGLGGSICKGSTWRANHGST
jgi:hypothetical protein